MFVNQKVQEMIKNKKLRHNYMQTFFFRFLQNANVVTTTIGEPGPWKQHPSTLQYNINV